MPRSGRWSVLAVATGLVAAWTFATWLLEGRIRTFLRPDAAADRLPYLVIANALVGLGGATLLLRREASRGSRPAGLAPVARTALSVVVGAALGALFFFVQRSELVDRWVLLNAHAQVWTVTVAELAVCWWALGSGSRAALPSQPAAAAALTVTLGAVAFGLYHFGHSPPFDTWAMVGKLTLVGLATGVFFVVSNDLWGTAIFHNWAAVIGVTDALAGAEALDAYRHPRWSTLLAAVVAFALLLAADRWVRRGRASRSDAPGGVPGYDLGP